ncbi:RNase A-like domain-containing protein, partial [Nocardioides hankookensis]
GAKARGILDSLRVLTAGPALATRDAAAVAGGVGARAQWINGARVMFTDAGERAAAPRSIDRTVTFLGRHEGPRRGHVLRDHVGKSPSELYWRALNDPFTNRASSFHDEATAARLISETLGRKEPEISGWLAGTRPQRLIDDVFTDATGIVVDSSGYVRLVKGLRMVLVRDRSMPEGYWIKTAFPQSVR